MFEIGLAVNYDYQIHEDDIVRVAAAHYSECGFVDAAFLHLGLRGPILNKGGHSINGGLGPTFLFTEDWHKFKEYTEDGFYGDRVDGKWQYRFLLSGCPT